MRYYNLCIYSPPILGIPPSKSVLVKKKEVIKPSELVLQFSSTAAPKKAHTPQRMPGGSPIDPYDPGALEISFQFTQADLAKADSSTGGAFVKVNGIDITTINQASNLVGHTLILKAGMGKGLPLSNPDQVGTILHGTIQSSLGNWADKEMNITFFVSTHQTPPPYRERKAFILHCQKGQSIKKTLENAFLPTVYNPKIDTKIQKDYIARHDFTGYYNTLKEFCVASGDLWQQHANSPLTVHISGQNITISDQYYPTSIKNLDFNDLIGQPTWNGSNEISIMCPLRGDIQVNDLISLPNETATLGIYANNIYDQSKTTQKNNSLFSGIFKVTDISYLGDFRNKDGKQWTTTIKCKPCSEKYNSLHS